MGGGDGIISFKASHIDIDRARKGPQGDSAKWLQPNTTAGSQIFLIFSKFSPISPNSRRKRLPAIDDSLKRLQEAACERCRRQTGWRFDSNRHDHSRLLVMAQLLSRQRFNFMQFFYCSFRKSGNTCQSWDSFTDDMSRLHHKVHYSYSAKATDLPCFIFNWKQVEAAGSV